MATIKDIAKIAQVSVGTVSNVINGKQNVDPFYREKVLKVIKKLDYKMNLQAKGFALKRSFNIGIVIPEITEHYLPKFLNYIEDVANEKGFHVILASSRHDPQREIEVTNALIAKNIDGIILYPCSAENSAYFQKMAEDNYPIIFVARYFSKLDAHFVIADNILTSQKVIEYLYHKGHRNITFIVGNLKLSADFERYIGFKKAVQEFGLKETSKIYFSEDARHLAGYNAIMEMANTGALPTAIYANDDYIALGCMKACYHLGIKIPDDLSLIGIGSFYPRNTLYQNLTTFDPHPEQLAHKAINLVFKAIEDRFNNVSNSGSKEKKLVEMTLVEGETVRELF